MNFGQAIEALKAGKIVRRADWEASDFVWLKKPAIVVKEWCKDPILHKVAEWNGGSFHADGAVCYSGTLNNGGVTTGWQPTCTEMLAEDWELFDLDAAIAEGE